MAETAAASGWCSRCNCSHSLPVGESGKEALRLRQRILTRGSIDLHAAEPAPACATTLLYGEGRGKMFGVLEVCDAAGDRRFLYAFSGLYNGLRQVPGWVPPLPDSAEYERRYSRLEPQIKAITRKLAGSAESGRPALQQQRKALSRRLNSELQELYRLRNFRGEERSLSELFTGRGIPTGTGDCCTPKLLHAAACQELKPVSLCEFFMGRATRSGSCRDGGFYPPCEAKCVPLLGFLLCGIEEMA